MISNNVSYEDDGDGYRKYKTVGTELKITYSYMGDVLRRENTGIGAINPIRYRGYYYDSESGFYYLLSRYYDPETGRFINADDYGYLGASGTVLGYNLFAYCENNPVDSMDPNGYFAMTVTLTAGAFYTIYHVVLSLGVSVIVGEAIYRVISTKRVGLKYSVKLNQQRITSPIGRRNNYNSRKKAKEAAKRAGGDREPIHHPKGCHGNKKPHYHPNVKNKFRTTPNGASSHDHYIYPS